MAQKGTGMDDVKRPERVLPSATARPILVSNGPVLASDPMMAPSEGDRKESGSSAVPVSQTAKTIKPPDSLLDVPTREAGITPAGGAEVHGEGSSVELPKEPASQDERKPSDTSDGSMAALKPDSTPITGVEKTPGTDPGRDPEAAITAEEAAAAEARAKREHELEELIAGGKYAVPINAVQRRRSRMNIMVLSTVALLLAVALLDVVADVGIVKAPDSVPHTHFFGK